MSEAGTVLCVVGATATGKSSVADLVAQALSSSVVSTDAMQVYRGMDIGTAKTPVSQRICPLLMVDVCEVGEDYSVARFQLEARRVVDELIARDLVPVLTGGTGLYLDAVIDEMDFPQGDARGDRRARLDEYARERGGQALWDLLNERDPRSAALIHPHNVRRVERALEMADEGTSYADAAGSLHEHKAHYPARIWGLRMDREALNARIDQRVDRMFDEGLVSEVRALVERGMGEALTSRQAIGYKEVLDHLAGRLTLQETIELVKSHTRQYAKRQMTWFRRDERIEWLDVDDRSSGDVAGRILKEWEASERG